MVSVRSLLFSVTLGTGFVSTWAKPVLSAPSRASTTISASEPDPSFAVSVELGGATYVNKVNPSLLFLFQSPSILLEVDVSIKHS